jgi:hypothetical protein
VPLCPKWASLKGVEQLSRLHLHCREPCPDQRSSDITIQHDPSVENDAADIFRSPQHSNIIERIAIDDDKVSYFAFIERTDAIVQFEEPRTV